MLLGEYNQFSEEDEKRNQSRRKVYGIDKTINHPNYKEGSLYHDIALYQLKTEVEFDVFIRPICLQTDSSVSERRAIGTGWGFMESSEY